MHDEVVIFGRRVVLTVEGPDHDRRFSATIHEPGSGRVLTRTPVRGRSAADARDRALEVLHNLIGIERLQEAIVAVARELAPGALVELTEDAQAVRADVSGAWALALPLAVPRDEVYDPEFDPEAFAVRVRAHFATHLRRVTR